MLTKCRNISGPPKNGVQTSVFGSSESRLPSEHIVAITLKYFQWAMASRRGRPQVAIHHELPPFLVDSVYSFSELFVFDMR